MRSLNIPARYVRVILPLILLCSALIAWFSLTRGHVWGDDFAGYINQAQAILNGNTPQLVSDNGLMNQRSVIPPGPDAYPWGYPLLIAPVVAIFGTSPIPLKAINILFFVIALIFVHKFAIKRLPAEYAFLVTALVAFSPLFIGMNDLIQSDIPFFALVYFVLWLVDSENDHWTHFVLTGLSIFAATFIRTTGFTLGLLLLPLLFDRRDRKKKVRNVFISGGVFMVLFAVQFVIFPSGEGSYFSHFGLFTWMGLLENIQLYISVPAEFFGHQLWASAFYGLFAFGFLIAQKSANKTDKAVQIFFFVNLIILVLWPESQGTRFLLPLFPIFLVRATHGYINIANIYPNLKNSFKWAFVALCAVFLISGGILASRNMNSMREINGPYDTYSMQAYQAVKQLTEKEDVIVFFKPRALALFTQRAAYAYDTCSGLGAGDYVLINKKQGNNLQIDPEGIGQCDRVISEPIYTNKRFALYEIK